MRGCAPKVRLQSCAERTLPTLTIVDRISRQRARSLIRWAKKSRDAALLTRALAIEKVLHRGAAFRSVAQELQCVASSVSRWVHRFQTADREGLLDRRVMNGDTKATPGFQQVVTEVLWGCPLDYGYTRPTWTRELLVLVVQARTGVKVSVCVMGRVLRRMRARRGNPKPIVLCPLSLRQQCRRLAKIRRLIAELPANEVALYEDEADIHLNPKIGLDWMPRGHQRLVITPGKNQKAYVAGALDTRDGTIVWTGATQKNTSLFIQLLEKLAKHYPNAKRIHVILDNYRIHSSGEARSALRQLGRIRLHFLPPYSPDHNRIERQWQLSIHLFFFRASDAMLSKIRAPGRICSSPRRIVMDPGGPPATRAPMYPPISASQVTACESVGISSVIVSVCFLYLRLKKMSDWTSYLLSSAEAGRSCSFRLLCFKRSIRAATEAIRVAHF